MEHTQTQSLQCDNKHMENQDAQMCNPSCNLNDIKIAVVGLGYVGLPLACLFAQKYPVVGYDLNLARVKQINEGIDCYDDIDPAKLRSALDHGMVCSDNAADMADCNFYVVAVPTPVDVCHVPILDPLESASRAVGKCLKKGDYVVFESTVYPGTTEDICVPILEETSGLKFNEDFFVGYSPERINPGDKVHTVENICKITSGSTPEAAELIDAVYASVLLGGTYRAQSIKVAEAAKIIENSQRDVNIAFINEVSKIFNNLGINTNDVIDAASTKWNFHSYRPGLVGGHCIGVDPYYLIHYSQRKGFTPKVMNEARRINDTMGYYVADRVTSELIRRGILVRESRILILGFAFKPNCRDTRNTKVEDVYKALHSYTSHVTVYDPLVDADKVWMEYGIPVQNDPAVLAKDYDAVIQCVNHDDFAAMDLQALTKPEGFVFYVNDPRSERIEDKKTINM